MSIHWKTYSLVFYFKDGSLTMGWVGDDSISPPSERRVEYYRNSFCGAMQMTRVLPDTCFCKTCNLRTPFHEGDQNPPDGGLSLTSWNRVIPMRCDSMDVTRRDEAGREEGPKADGLTSSKTKVSHCYSRDRQDDRKRFGSEAKGDAK
ncbi:hypothetical protein CDAR_318941 [Caerostris darwini]|uniref:Uncharacterized protein n=1 Tax=Caerostris darwini TaxID=1538125 RepID=A0AAV4TYK5_9ARAC|nr:hypothetical protein CDAR_318941 [Caerostris darwini]